MASAITFNMMFGKNRFTGILDNSNGQQKKRSGSNERVKEEEGESTTECCSISGPENINSELSTLHSKAAAFLQAVPTRDRIYRMRTYSNVFVGSEAVDALVHCGLARHRLQAVELGKALSELGLFYHVSKANEEFKDEYLFYRYNDSIRDQQHIIDSGSGDKNDEQTARASELGRKANDFRNLVTLQDRKYMGLTYRQCFVGSEAVDMMLFAGLSESREDAVNLGQKLQRELRLFSHICGTYLFEDKDDFYYRFRDGDNLVVPAASIAPSAKKPKAMLDRSKAHEYRMSQFFDSGNLDQSPREKQSKSSKSRLDDLMKRSTHKIASDHDFDKQNSNSFSSFGSGVAESTGSKQPSKAGLNDVLRRQRSLSPGRSGRSNRSLSPVGTKMENALKRRVKSQPFQDSLDGSSRSLSPSNRSITSVVSGVEKVEKTPRRRLKKQPLQDVRSGLSPRGRTSHRASLSALASASQASLDGVVRFTQQLSLNSATTASQEGLLARSSHRSSLSSSIHNTSPVGKGLECAMDRRRPSEQGLDVLLKTRSSRRLSLSSTGTGKLKNCQSSLVTSRSTHSRSAVGVDSAFQKRASALGLDIKTKRSTRHSGLGSSCHSIRSVESAPKIRLSSKGVNDPLHSPARNRNTVGSSSSQSSPSSKVESTLTKRHSLDGLFRQKTKNLSSSDLGKSSNHSMGSAAAGKSKRSQIAAARSVGETSFKKRPSQESLDVLVKRSTEGLISAGAKVESAMEKFPSHERFPLLVRKRLEDIMKSGSPLVAGVVSPTTKLSSKLDLGKILKGSTNSTCTAYAQGTDKHDDDCEDYQEALKEIPGIHSSPGSVASLFSGSLGSPSSKGNSPKRRSLSNQRRRLRQRPIQAKQQSPPSLLDWDGLIQSKSRRRGAQSPRDVDGLSRSDHKCSHLDHFESSNSPRDIGGRRKLRSSSNSRNATRKSNGNELAQSSDHGDGRSGDRGSRTSRRISASNSPIELVVRRKSRSSRKSDCDDLAQSSDHGADRSLGRGFRMSGRKSASNSPRELVGGRRKLRGATVRKSDCDDLAQSSGHGDGRSLERGSRMSGRRSASNSPIVIGGRRKLRSTSNPIPPPPVVDSN